MMHPILMLLLGVRPSDLDRFNIPVQCRLPMTEEDIKTGKVGEIGCHMYPDRTIWGGGGAVGN